MSKQQCKGLQIAQLRVFDAKKGFSLYAKLSVDSSKQKMNP
jgi:hypothetical protein